MQKVLFIDTAHPVLKEELTQIGYTCEDFTSKSYDECAKIINRYEGAVIRSKINFDKALLDAATGLKFIARVGAGMESIDVDYAKQKGIACFNSPEGNRDAVAEHALAMLLNLFNNLHKANAQVKSGVWKREENRGIEIKGKTIGIIGCGNMGNAFAERLCGFGCNVIAYDKYKTGYTSQFVKETSMQELYEACDVVSLHLPLTDETKYLVNENFINKFKKDFWLINTARGKIVDTQALVHALQSGKIKGAGLDVNEYEKTSFEEISTADMPEPLKYLVSSDNVILTPHIAGWTHESKYKLAKVLADKIKQWALNKAQ